MAVSSADALIAVAELARQVRGTTLDLLNMPDRSWLTWTPPGTSNHILWHAGHAVWVNDTLTVAPITGRSELPEGWSETFGQNSHPEMVSVWPEAAEVRRQLELQLARVLELFTTHAEAIMANASRKPAGGGWPLLPGIIHGWHDEARHQGEMYLLLKVLQARK